MRHVGHIRDFPELNEIVGLIFKRQFLQVRLSNGQLVKAKSFQPKNLWYVDMGDLRYVEQNPNTRSAYARRSQQGTQIVWVIRKSDNTYMGRIEDGEIYMKPFVETAYER